LRRYIEAAFNFHFEIILGESVSVFADLLTDTTVVRSEVEYATLVLYSFFAPLLIIFVMVNMILGQAVQVKTNESHVESVWN